MKLKTKILLIFILFLFACTLNVYASVPETVIYNGSEETLPDYSNLVTCLEKEGYSVDTPAIVAYWTSPPSYTGPYLVCFFKYDYSAYNVSDLYVKKVNGSSYYDTYSLYTTGDILVSSTCDMFTRYYKNSPYWYKVYSDMPAKFSNERVVCYSDYNHFDYDDNLIYKSDYILPEPEIDKINLFELNLTDLDYNNTVHQFNLSTYTNSSCYDELINYYNNDYQYAIYLTDYQRVLTYDNEVNMNLKHGSYLLSGYIDFLIQDDAVFFYDKEEEKIRVGTGIYDTITPTDKPIKRFYFKLIYSEDSNDSNVEIWENNGNLFPITVSQIDNSYFVGSSQTIYYATNSYKYNMYLRELSVYYKGYLNPFEFGEKVRDISSTPFYVYNFSFGGGTTKLLFSNSSTYTEDIKNIYNDAQNIYDKDEIPEDSGDGNSYIQGQGSTSSSYNEWEITDDTTQEEDSEYENETRLPITNISEDRSDWGVLDYLKYIVDKIIAIPENILKGLYNLFIPTDGQWKDIQKSYLELQNLIETKIPFVADFKNRLETGSNNTANSDFLNITMPSFSYYGGQTEAVTVINVKQIYEPYRENIRGLLALIVYGSGFVFILKHVLNYNSNSNDKDGD